MIVSASRRTDIPNYYSDWFYHRLKEGYVYVRNPMNPHQVSKICLTPEVVDCIVFWTKNPEPMLEQIGELKDFHYYFQFTLTGYGFDVETKVPHKKERMIPIFRKLSEKIGAEKVIWRYDPILFNEIYTEEYHIRAFSQIATALFGYTKKCVISFVDSYAKNKSGLEALQVRLPEKEHVKRFAQQLSRIAHSNHMEIAACAEEMDLSECGIRHNSCIDKELIEKMIGGRLKAEKDKNQRKSCGCMESIDIGAYDTCKNGCKYCYANHSLERVKRNSASYDRNAPLLCSIVTEEDSVTERLVRSWRDGQLQIFDS